MALTFGCSSDKDDNNPPPAPAIPSSSGGDNLGSSSSGNIVGSSSSGGSVVVSSSSGGNASVSSSSVTGSGNLSSSSGGSSSGGVVFGADVTYQNETYKTVKIGTQTWFQRNLNYAVTGSKCGSGSSLSDANTATCDTYGRLYNWATAMNLPSNCNTSSCASSITPIHKGICPSGWHIPSDADWDALMTAVGGFRTAGTKLKANSALWSAGRGKGTDDFGFAALPGGLGSSDGGFIYVNMEGLWWSASEINSGNVHSRAIISSSDEVEINIDVKNDLLSVRCVQD